MENRSEIQRLFRRYLDDDYSPEDLRRIIDYFKAGRERDTLVVLIRAELLRDSIIVEDENAIQRVTAEVDKRLSLIFEENTRVVPLYRKWYLYAAAMLALLIAGIGVIYFNRQPASSSSDHQALVNDVSPGGNRATLTLADESVVTLEGQKDGIMIEQPGSMITQSENGLLSYQPDELHSAPVGFNKVSTPKGGQYRIVLPDGSRVWLNAASSLRYPTRFTDNQRKVELTGEGYFEVTHLKGMPFVVESEQQNVEVLGTEFNINAYADEAAVKTTLVNGSVKVLAPTRKIARMLLPGQQSSIQGETITIKEVQTEEAVAWKDGVFRFQNTDIKVLMRQLERWYDIEIDESVLPNKRFYAEIGRDVKLSQVLKMIEVTSNLKFRLEGKTLIWIKD